MLQPRAVAGCSETTWGATAAQGASHHRSAAQRTAITMGAAAEALPGRKSRNESREAEEAAAEAAAAEEAAAAAEEAAAEEEALAGVAGLSVGGGLVGAVGPAWTRGEIEQPAGEKDMGGWTAAVYTDEQQARLGVSADGTPLAAAPPPETPAESAS